MRYSCQVIQQCPREKYMNCPAFLAGKNCWQVSGVLCCKRNIKNRCQDCKVYLASQATPMLPHHFIRPTALENTPEVLALFTRV